MKSKDVVADPQGIPSATATVTASSEASLSFTGGSGAVLPSVHGDISLSASGFGAPLTQQGVQAQSEGYSTDPNLMFQGSQPSPNSSTAQQQQQQQQQHYLSSGLSMGLGGPLSEVFGGLSLVHSHSAPPSAAPIPLPVLPPPGTPSTICAP